MKIWYNQGTHIITDNIHILCDPTFTNLSERDYDEYVEHRKKNTMNPDYSNINFVLISHAHADHIDRLDYFEGMNIPIITHPMTASLKDKLFKTFENVILLVDKGTINLNNIKVTAFNSGHCGGSLMYFIESSEGTILFTGDINDQSCTSTYPPISMKCDVLIIEASFGDPKYIFPNRSVVEKEIYDYLNDSFEKSDTILMYGQALGKNQDMIMLIRSFSVQDIMIALDLYTYSCTKIYDTFYGPIEPKIPHGNMNVAFMSQSDLFLPKKKTLFICHSSSYKIDDVNALCEKYGLYNPPICVLSGYGTEFIENVIEAFPWTKVFKISSHSDYQGLVNFINLCNPNVICSFHGKSPKFKQICRNEFKWNIFNIHEDIVTYDGGETKTEENINLIK